MNADERQHTSVRGFSLVELLCSLGILLLLLSLAVPGLLAFSSDARILGAADVFKGEFRKARSAAATTGRYTAIRFEQGRDGDFVSVYQDGNNNGVLGAEIARGIDRRISGPRRLDSGATGVRIGIHPGIPAPPPDTGPLDARDPIKFGRSNMLSFTSLGGATPGTFYLAGDGVQAAVRVNGTTGRVRLLIYRKGQWRER